MAGGRRRDPCWEHATEIPDPNNPNKRKWRCNHCESDFAGGASRIKVHLGLETGEGIKPCKKYKRGQVADEALEQGNTSAGPYPLVADLGSTLAALDTNTIQRTSPPRHLETGLAASTSDAGSVPVLNVTQPYTPPPINDQPRSKGDIPRKNIIPEQRNHSGPMHIDTEANSSSIGAIPSVQLYVRDEVDGAITSDMQSIQSLGESTLLFFEDIQGIQSLEHNEPMQVEREFVNARERPQQSSSSSSVAMESKRREFFELALHTVGRDHIVDEIRHSLMDQILCIGVYGMGGVGKTTIMKRLYDKVRGDAAFGKVLWVTVSQDCSLDELQNKLSMSLEVADAFRNVDKVMRPTFLNEHLRQRGKTLIILDDLWQHSNLNELGIKLTRDGDTQLVLTTRDQDVCQRMMCEEEFEVKCLLDDDAMNLFEKTLGYEISNSRKGIAKNNSRRDLFVNQPLCRIKAPGSVTGRREIETRIATAAQPPFRRRSALASDFYGADYRLIKSKTVTSPHKEEEHGCITLAKKIRHELTLDEYLDLMVLLEKDWNKTVFMSFDGEDIQVLKAWIIKAKKT